MTRAKYCSSTCCQANAMEAFERRGGRRGIRLRKNAQSTRGDAPEATR